MGQTPIIFDPKRKKLEEFKKHYPLDRVVDMHEEQLKEVFMIRNPHFRFGGDYEEELQKFLKDSPEGTWFYFPWIRTLIHYLRKDLHEELHTARNKNVITAEEQSKLSKLTIGICGLSVGSHAALTLAMLNIGSNFKLADPDNISGSNLNRIRLGYGTLGRNKCLLAAEQLYEINPYLNITLYEQGLTPSTILKFLKGPPKIDILIEEMDNLEMKIRVREEAKKLRIPVLMATDNADNIIVDIERYDLDRNLKIFNGLAGDLNIKTFQKIRPQDIPKLATKLAGPNYVHPRQLGSVLQVGKTLYSWPQLGTAATLSGVAVTYLVKRIALGEKTLSGKYEINLEQIFDPDYSSTKAKSQRKKEKDKFLKIIGLN